MPQKLIEFSVGINYKSSKGLAICIFSSTDALLAKIKWAMPQNMLTPDDISAVSATVRTKETHQISKSERTIEFLVEITYEFDAAFINNPAFLDGSLAENLYYAITKSRLSGKNGEGLYLVEGDISTDDVSATPLYTEITKG